jgi:hypothetical protein
MRVQPALFLLCFATLAPTFAARAGDCDHQEDVRQQAECIHDRLMPDGIMQLLRLALSTTDGHAADAPASNDFLYIAEEAGEAARRTGLQPVIDLVTAKDIRKVLFAARAIGAFLDAVEHGYSHNRRFDGKGDPELFAKARKVLRGPCDRLAKHKSSMVQTEGKRCLGAINRDQAAAMGKLLSEPATFQGIGPVPVGGSGSNLRGIRAPDSRSTRKPKRNAE